MGRGEESLSTKLEHIDWMQPIWWIKSVFEKAGVSELEISESLHHFASYSQLELKAVIIAGLNSILLSEKENINYLILEVRVNRIVLNKARDNKEAFHRVYESFIDFFVNFFRESEIVKKSVKGHLFLVPFNDRSLITPLYLFFEKCLQLALTDSDGELDRIIEIGTNLTNKLCQNDDEGGENNGRCKRD